MRNCILLAGLSFATAFAAAPKPLGFVSDCSKTWVDRRTGKEIAILYEVRADSQIYSQANENARYLEIRFNANPAKPQRFECASRKTCGPLDLAARTRFLAPETPQNDGALPSFLTAAREIISGSPETYQLYATAMSRSGAVNRVRDGVAARKPDGIDVSDIFANSPAVTYLISFFRVDRDVSRQPAEPQDAMSFRWSPETRPVLAARDLSPGLYRMDLCRDDGHRLVASGQFALVLIADPPNDEKLTAQFRQARSITGQWEGSDSSTTALLRAYLVSLSPAP
jgi:hypothetical protein